MIEKSIFKDGANKNLTHPEKNKGITLIALIITIIVLLILAGVTILALTGDSGIISNAEKATELTRLANLKEIAELVKQETILDEVAIYRNSGKIKKATLIANLNKEFKGSTVENGIITTSDGKYNIVVGDDLKITVVNNEENSLKNGEIDIIYFYDEAEQEKGVSVFVYAKVDGVGSYEEYAEKILDSKNNDDAKELMFIEADRYWNGIIPGTEGVTDFAEYMKIVLEGNENAPKTLTDFKNVFAPDFETVDEMLINWGYVEPEGYYGKTYTQYAQEILDGITETGEQREEILEQYFIEGWNYLVFGEQRYTTWEDVMLYWQENNWTTYENIEELATDWGYNNVEEFLLYDDWYVEPQGYEEYQQQLLQDRMVTIECSNGESYNTEVGEILEFYITENGQYTFTATTDGKVKEVTIDINNIVSMTLEETNIELYVGDSKELKVITTPSEKVNSLVYSTSNANIATVDSTGKITAIGIGSTIITVSMPTLTNVKAECKVKVKKIPGAPIGDYVTYGVSYKDMYTNYEFTTSNGWRILDGGTSNGDGTYSNVKLISTGIPAKVCYHYYKNTGETANGWWGTDEQVTNIYGSEYAYRYYPSIYAEVGLKENFELISFTAGTSASENQGCYAKINSIATGSITGSIFKVAGASEVHNLTLEELNTARNFYKESTFTATTDGDTGLFYLRDLEIENSSFGYTTSTKPYYWLASASTVSSIDYYLRYVDNYGNIHSGYNNPLGVRVVVSLSSKIQKDEAGNWEIVQ